MVGTRFVRLLGLAWLLAALGSAHAAPAAQVDFVVGLVQAIDAQGKARPVLKGASVATGDTVLTHDGRAQLRFTDGGYVSLQPDTEFAIREYRFAGRADGSERGFFSLLRGAMRTVTGLIGRANREAYAVQTPTATIGIRGTGGLFVVRPDGSTLVTTTSGTFRLSNPLGSIELPAGATGFAGAGQAAPPRRTAETISLPPPPRAVRTDLLPPSFVAGDERLRDGAPNALGKSAKLASADGDGALPPIVTVLSIDYSYAEFDAKRDPPVVLTAIGNDGTGALADATDAGLKQFKADTVVYNRASAVAVDRGSDGLATWERWVGNAVGNTALKFGESGGLHLVYGAPTPEMPKIGLWSYAFTGGTSPTFANESAAPGRFTGGTLQADFGTQRIGVDFSLTINDESYRVATTGPVAESPIALKGAAFAGGRVPTTNFGKGCVDGCTAFVAGSFFGAAAAAGPPPGGGLVYQINNAASPGGNTTVHGAAGFGKPRVPLD